MQPVFESVTALLDTQLQSSEIYLCSFYGELTEFARFNQGCVRQAGTIQQMEMQLTLIQGKRQSAFNLRLSGQPDLDQTKIVQALKQMRSVLSTVPEDPYLLYSETVQSSHTPNPSSLFHAAEMVQDIIAGCTGLDMVGILVSGNQYTGFANSLGQRNWHASQSFNFDWSVYYQTDKAVKNAYAGTSWDKTLFLHKVEKNRQELEIMKQSPITIDPGNYCVYLAPSALWDIVEMMGWGGFSAQAQMTKHSPLHRLSEGLEQLHPKINLKENTQDGFAPRFQSSGFIKPSMVPLIDAGTYQQHLISPRSAKEYHLITNGADASEAPSSLELQPGSLKEDSILSALHTGVYINNLWYLNYSDPNAAKITGMTRFACFWVENAKIQAPVNVMRFDDSLYQLLGRQLDDLTIHQETLLNPSTYDRRSYLSMRLPGALIQSMTFTL